MSSKLCHEMFEGLQSFIFTREIRSIKKFDVINKCRCKDFPGFVTESQVNKYIENIIIKDK